MPNSEGKNQENFAEKNQRPESAILRPTVDSKENSTDKQGYFSAAKRFYNYAMTSLQETGDNDTFIQDAAIAMEKLLINTDEKKSHKLAQEAAFALADLEGSIPTMEAALEDENFDTNVKNDIQRRLKDAQLLREHLSSKIFEATEKEVTINTSTINKAIRQISKVTPTIEFSVVETEQNLRTNPELVLHRLENEIKNWAERIRDMSYLQHEQVYADNDNQREDQAKRDIFNALDALHTLRRISSTLESMVYGREKVTSNDRDQINITRHTIQKGGVKNERAGESSETNEREDRVVKRMVLAVEQEKTHNQGAVEQHIVSSMEYTPLITALRSLYGNDRNVAKRLLELRALRDNLKVPKLAEYADREPSEQEYIANAQADTEATKHFTPEERQAFENYYRQESQRQNAMAKRFSNGEIGMKSKMPDQKIMSTLMDLTK